MPESLAARRVARFALLAPIVLGLVNGGWLPLSRRGAGAEGIRP